MKKTTLFLQVASVLGLGLSIANATTLVFASAPTLNGLGPYGKISVIATSTDGGATLFPAATVPVSSNTPVSLIALSHNIVFNKNIATIYSPLELYTSTDTFYADPSQPNLTNWIANPLSQPFSATAMVWIPPNSNFPNQLFAYGENSAGDIEGEGSGLTPGENWGGTPMPLSDVEGHLLPGTVVAATIDHTNNNNYNIFLAIQQPGGQCDYSIINDVGGLNTEQPEVQISSSGVCTISSVVWDADSKDFVGVGYGLDGEAQSFAFTYNNNTNDFQSYPISPDSSFYPTALAANGNGTLVVSGYSHDNGITEDAQISPQGVLSSFTPTGSIHTGQALMDIIWDGPDNEFVAVGNGGVITTSHDAQNWNTIVVAPEPGSTWDSVAVVNSPWY